MQPYLDSDSTTFVTPAGLLHGRAAIEGRYRASYWKGGPPADRLRFGDVDVRMLGPDHALLTGRYHLVSPAGEPKGEGPFSLVLRRGPEGWRIVHDHSG